MSDNGDKGLRKALSWIIVISVSAFALFSLILLVRAGFRPGLLSDLYFSLLRDHFVAVVGLPMAAVASLFIVLVLRSTSGPIEFEAVD